MRRLRAALIPLALATPAPATELPNLDDMQFQSAPTRTVAVRKATSKAARHAHAGQSDWKPYFPAAPADPCASHSFQLGCEYGTTQNNKPKFGPEIMKKPYQ